MPLPSRHQLPPSAFHPLPTLPSPSHFRPLDPRPRFIPTRRAPPPPTDSTPHTSACTRRLPILYQWPFRKHLRSIRWTVGIALLVPGIACLVSGITVIVVNAPYTVLTLDSRMEGVIAGAVLGILGLTLVCGSTVYLVWLICTRVKPAPPHNEDQREGGTTRGVPMSEREPSALGLENLQNLSEIADETTLADAQHMKASELATGHTLYPRIQDKNGKGHPKAQQQGMMKSPSITILLSPRSPGMPPIDATVKQPKSHRTINSPGQASTGWDPTGSSGRTSFLDLDDEMDFFGTELQDDMSADLDQGTRISAAKHSNTVARSTYKHPATKVRQQPQHQSHTPIISNPAREKWRATQRAMDGSPQSDTFVRPIQKQTNLDKQYNNGLQDLLRYTTSYKRLGQDERLQAQHYVASQGTRSQEVHGPKLAIRARNDIAKALGHAVEQSAAVTSIQLKSKQKAKETLSGDSKASDGDKAYQSTDSVSPSPSMVELADLAVRSSGFPSVFSVATLPGPTSKPPHLDSQRLSPHVRCSGDSQGSRACQNTTSSPVSPMERDPGDLVLRMRNAHKRSESAGQMRLLREIVVGEEAEFSLAPFLPATTYVPERSRPYAHGGTQTVKRPMLPSRAATSPVGSCIYLHARDIARREMVPAIQTRGISHSVTQHSPPTIPDPQTASFGTATSAHTAASPMIASDAAAATALQQPWPVKSKQPPTASTRNSSPMEAIHDVLGADGPKRQSCGAGDRDIARPLSYESEAEGGRDHECKG